MRLVVLLAALTLPVGLAGRAHGAERRVRAGGLAAVVSPQPWHLALVDGRGNPVLSELGGSGPGPSGALGFRVGTSWRHATQIVAERRLGRAYLATLATNDPGGRRIEVRLVPAGNGVISLDATVAGDAASSVTATGIAFDASGSERYLGFGERSNAVDQRGNTVESYVAEGPYRPAENSFIGAFVPPPGFHPRPDASYFPVPWLLSTSGYGVLVDNDQASYFRLGSDRPDAWSVEAEAGTLQLRFFAGPRPADVLRRFSARIGRQPPPAAPWYFGPWFQPRGDEDANVALLRDADAPASVAQTYTHYLPCGDQAGNRERERSRTSGFHAGGLAVTTYFNPMICTTYQPVYGRAQALDVLTKNPLGADYEYRYTGSAAFFVGQVDFSAPGATQFYGELLGEAYADGYDGWMEDFGEYTPLDARSANGLPGPQMHNKYPVLYHRAGYAFARRSSRPLVRFNRSGWTGSARYSQVVWGGDPSTDWGFDGLQSAIRNGLTMGLSGVSLWGSDIGGFFTLTSPPLTAELNKRWIELGAVSGVMRTQANGFPGGGPRSQILDPDVLPVWRRYAKLRTQLYPYLAAAEGEYQRTGMPIMRHLALTYPRDSAAIARDDEFLFGPDLLAAPVISPGATSRQLYLPHGRWIDLWRSAAYRESDGSLELGRASLLAGGREVTVPAPLSELPLLVRAGAVLPLLPANVDTLTGYGGGGAIVHLRDRRSALTLLAFPRGRSRAALGVGGTVSSREKRGRWALEIEARERRTYALQAAMGVLHDRFRPCAVRLDGRSLPASAWSYEPSRRLLRATFSARSGRLVVSGRCRHRAGPDEPPAAGHLRTP